MSTLLNGFFKYHPPYASIYLACNMIQHCASCQLMSAPVVVLLPLIIIFLSLPSRSLSSRNVPALIVFGDSTVDAGNNNHIKTIARADFPPYGRDFFGGRPTGRFCNGRLATDFISEALGLPEVVPAYLDPVYSISDFARGVCFASAGTGLDVATSDVVSVIPLMEEVQLFQEYREKLMKYVGVAEATHIINEAVYIVSIGTNDFLENYFTLVTGRIKQFTVEEFEDFLIGIAGDFLTRIYLLGARKISFTGLSPFGCVPLERTVNFLHGGECIEEFNQVAKDFNSKLQALFRRLCASLPGLKLRYAPVYDLLLHIFQNPSSRGFEDVKEGCCGTGKSEVAYTCNKYSPHTCLDADKYAFWDAIHPSEKLNRILANQTMITLAEFL